MKKMKIAMVTTQYLPVISGVSFYLRQLCEALAKKGHDITVYTEGTLSLEREEKMRGVTAKRFLPTTRLPRGYEVYGGMAEAIVQDKPDIVHSHQYGYYPCFAGLKAAQKLNVPHVVTPVLHPPKFGPARAALFKFYHHFQGKQVLKESDAILALSRHEVDELVKLGADKNRIEIIYNPVAKIFRPAMTNSSGRSRRLRHNKEKKQRLVMFVGPLGETKGADVAFEICLRIAERMPEARFLFVGKGALEGKFKHEAKRFGGRFEFRSGLSDRQLAGLYSRAAVLLAPTPYEAFGRAIAEAQACGTAVVSTKVGAIPEVVQDGKSGFVLEYGRWNEMGRKVEELLCSLPKAKKMGAEGPKFVRKNFSEEKFLAKHEKIYSKLNVHTGKIDKKSM